MKQNLAHPVTRMVWPNRAFAGPKPRAAGRLGLGTWAVVLAGIFAVVGCNPADQIERRVLTFEDTGIPEQVRLPPLANRSAEAVRSRMVTAIAALPTATWFFKAVGPVEDFEAAFPGFREFLQSVRFNENGAPQYTPPTGWQEAPLRPERFQTFLFGTGERKTIELAISDLAANQDLASNVNRWRNQLSLPPLDPNAANSSLDKLAYQGGEFLIFDEVGMYGGGMAPAAPSPHPIGSEGPPAAEDTGGASKGSDTATEAAAPTVPIEFTIPAQWERLPKAMFATVKLERKAAERKVALAVSEMNPELNTWNTAVESWLAELELSGLELAQVEPFVSEVTIDGQTGKQIRLVLPDATKGIVAARVERAGRAWFVKLSGDKSLVEESIGDWEAFVGSIRFK
ncbi:MAG: hypothetical protein LW697_06635 [Blastopirellula sp.]|nr:hypothetical protein [Blastopirellula sp.]